MYDSGSSNRRKVLKTIGAAVATGTVLSGTASARGNNYGNGNAVGAFLNEEALGKDNPIWTSGVADHTGEETVQVDVGTMVSLDMPEEAAPGEPPEEGPFGYSPRAVEVSTGTTVEWIWTENAFAFNPGEPWPHDVASFDTTGDHNHVFRSPMQGTGTFSHEFTETGPHLYYCHPHGDYTVEHPNLFGMRGAVIVTDE